MVTIYEKLKRMRERAGLRQKQIADYLGVTQTFISKVEAGEKNLTVDQLESVANLYGYSLGDFANMEDESKPPHFASKAREVSQEDLRAIAAVGKIAINSRFMTKVLGQGCCIP